MCSFTMKKLIILLVLYAQEVLLLNPEVTLPSGKVRGYHLQTASGRQVSAFEGIPYAKPPVGKHRFKEAQPNKPWQGTWEANTLHKCMQYHHYTKPGEDYVIGNEDCLYINVYTSDLLNTTLKDVIIFIHGGAFMFNHGGAYGPKYILDRDIVYVTFNYRLGPLGFLSTEDNIVPGNMGLKDQVLALKWIKTNIVFFGGNPHSITVTGMSAGGASTQFHALSPLSQGLFHRGISQSGLSLNCWVLVENSLEKAKQLADHLGCPTATTRDIVDCLRHRPAYQIVHAVKIFQPWLYNPFSPFGAVVDKWSTSPFLPDHPYVLLRNKQIQDLPWIFSNVESEGLYPGADFIGNIQHLEAINTQWNSLMPHVLDFNYTVDPTEQLVVLQKIKDYYFQEQPISTATISTLIKLLSDRLFIADIERGARLHSAAVTSPVYYYYFSYRGAHSKSEQQSGTNENYGASHGDDTTFVLSTSVDMKSTEEDKQMSKILTDMWITFAATNVPQVDNIIWTPLSKDTTAQLNLLGIQSPTNITNYLAPQVGHRDFWDTLPLKENKNLYIIKDEL